MKKKIIFYINTILVIVFLSSIPVNGHQFGITGRTLKNGVGCTCHGSSPFTNVTVQISGPTQVQASSTNMYAVTIVGGPLVAGGTNIAASTGALAPSGNDLQLLDGELTHTSPKSPIANAVIFIFSYTAPASIGTQTIFANGNSVNLDGTPQGDNWNFAQNFTVNVVSSTGVNDVGNKLSFRLDQNYPNPFNPSTQINYSIPENGNVNISVYDILGEKVSELINQNMPEGNYQIAFSTGNNNHQLSSGVYFYKLVFRSSTSGSEFTAAKKMMVIR